LKKKKSNNFERNFFSTNFLSKKVQGNAKMFLLIPAGIEIRQINSPFPPPLKLLLRLLVFFIFRFLLFVTFAAPNCIYFIHENKISLPFHFSFRCFFTVDVKSEQKKNISVLLLYFFSYITFWLKFTFPIFLNEIFLERWIWFQIRCQWWNRIFFGNNKKHDLDTQLNLTLT